MTSRLKEALRRHRHLPGERVLYREGGETMTESALREALARAVTQIFTGWNPLTSWLRQVERLRHAASSSP